MPLLAIEFLIFWMFPSLGKVPTSTVGIPKGDIYGIRADKDSLSIIPDLKMQYVNIEDIINRDVVIIGNGPSGLSLSYMLSGYIPYLVSDAHPDELLSARLAMIKDLSIIHQELGHLAVGLEGRSTNPVSLLLDALTHPCADIGLELQSLIEWRKDGIEIDHVVLGKGPPGGSWHNMDPNIFTLSLASWMSLPGLSYNERDGSEKRASAGKIARYYLEYCRIMGLEKYCRNDVVVVEVKALNQDCITQHLDNLDKTSDKGCSNSQTNNNRNEPMMDTITDGKGFTKLQIEKKSPSSSSRSCILSKALKLSHWRNPIKCKPDRCCKRRRNALNNDSSPERKIRDASRSISLNEGDLNELNTQDNNNKRDDTFSSKSGSPILMQNRNKTRSVSFSFCNHDSLKTSSCDNASNNSFNEDAPFGYPLKYSLSVDFEDSNSAANSKTCSGNSESDSLRLKVGCDSCCNTQSNKSTPKWMVKTFDLINKKYITYVCKYVVLANGANDLPNKLESLHSENDPSWLVHDLPNLENNLDQYVMELEEKLNNNQSNHDPVLIVGAGLSAADAVIATKCRNIPVIHIFRDSGANLRKQLPENMYPEYHKVHQMMLDGGHSYTDYLALPGYELVNFNNEERSVELKSQSGKIVRYNVSFAAVLIGSRPNMLFLPPEFNLGVKKHLPVDARTNPVNINKLSHKVQGFEGLYAMGPLVGDNFVRFIPGGALAIVSDLYRKYRY